MITLNTNSLKAACTMAATNDARFCLVGVHVIVDAKGAVRVQASDGHVAFDDVQTERAEEHSNTAIIIPLDRAKMIAKCRTAFVMLNPPLPGQSSWGSSEGISFVPIDDKFPDIDRVMPARNPEHDEIMLQYDWELVARCQKAMQIATGSPTPIFPLQNSPPYGAGLMYCLDSDYPRCAVMPIRI